MMTHDLPTSGSTLSIVDPLLVLSGVPSFPSTVSKVCSSGDLDCCGVEREGADWYQLELRPRTVPDKPLYTTHLRFDCIP